MYRYLVLVVLMGIFSVTAFSHECEPISVPGYRPPAEAESEKLFRESLGNMEITVFPTVVRRFDGTEYDEASMERACSFIEKNNIAKPQSSNQKIDLSESMANIQWQVFQKGMSLFADHLKANPVKTEFALLIDFLVAPGKEGSEAVGGIQCYVLDSKGKNVFSFLLNSHHKLFTDAQMIINDTTAESKAKLIKTGTEVVLEALRLQLDLEDKNK